MFSLFGPKKYKYVYVCFQGSRKRYCYRTKSRFYDIHINDVVMVPVFGKEDQPAIVADVIICTEFNAPYPLERTKIITGPAGWRKRRLFKGVDMRPPVVRKPAPVVVEEEDDELDWIDELEMFDAIFDDD